MNKLSVDHGSVSDWDWENPGSKILDTATYVSPPSSLRALEATPATVYVSFLCRVPDTQDIPYGRLVTYFRQNGGTVEQLLYFKNQTPLGSWGDVNTYLLYRTLAFFRCVRLEGGFPTEIKTWPKPYIYTAWEHTRLTWFPHVPPPDFAAMEITVEVEAAGVWQAVGTPAYDLNEKWKTSGINRVGGRLRTSHAFPVWCDDTEIWVLA